MRRYRRQNAKRRSETDLCERAAASSSAHSSLFASNLGWQMPRRMLSNFLCPEKLSARKMLFEFLCFFCLFHFKWNQKMGFLHREMKCFSIYECKKEITCPLCCIASIYCLGRFFLHIAKKGFLSHSLANMFASCSYAGIYINPDESFQGIKLEIQTHQPRKNNHPMKSGKTDSIFTQDFFYFSYPPAGTFLIQYLSFPGLPMRAC